MKVEMMELKALIASTPKNHSPMFSDKASFETYVQGSKKKARASKELKLNDDDNDESVTIPPPPPPLETFKVNINSICTFDW